MILISPTRARFAVVRAVGALYHATLAAVPPALVYLTAHPTFLSVWVQIGVPAAAMGLAILTKGLMSPAAEVGWDRDGLHVLRTGQVVDIPWSEYERHRLTWEIPAKLKLYRDSQRPVVIDLYTFPEDERRALVTELALRSNGAA